MLCHSTHSLSHPTSGHCILQSIHNHNFSTHLAIQLATRQVSLASQAGRQCVAERDSRQRRTRGEESGEWGERGTSMRPKDSPKSFQIVEWSKTHCDNWQYSLGRWSITRAANTCSSRDETRAEAREACAESLLIGSATATVVNGGEGRRGGGTRRGHSDHSTTTSLCGAITRS